MTTPTRPKFFAQLAPRFRREHGSWPMNPYCRHVHARRVYRHAPFRHMNSCWSVINPRRACDCGARRRYDAAAANGKLRAMERVHEGAKKAAARVLAEHPGFIGAAMVWTIYACAADQCRYIAGYTPAKEGEVVQVVAPNVLGTHDA